MRRNAFEFLRRGFSACGAGPLILAVVYLIMGRTAGLESLTVGEVCTGIFSLTALAFIAGGMNFIYQIEKVPLMLALLIHGSVLYVSYLATYLINGWLKAGHISILVFSFIFVVGYLVIWAIIYSMVRKKTESLNERLNEKRKLSDNKSDIS